MNPSDDDLRFAGEALDPFAPSRADDMIAAALRDRDAASESSEGRLVMALAAGHALPAGADAALERVRIRLASTPLNPDAVETVGGEVSAPHPPERRHVPRPITRTQNALRALAAMLLVALLAGGFVLALHGRQGAVTHAPHWVDVSITRAHTTRPLDFTPGHAISYAVAEAGGIIYACSGTSLWYSDDDGATYAPFTPAPPTGTMDGKCTLSTVPGLPGVFVRNLLPGSYRISYGEPDGSWRTLGLPGAVHASAVDPGATLPVLAVPPGQVHQDIESALFFPGPLGNHLAQYAGQWLFVIDPVGATAHQAQSPGSALIGTRDFGKTWVWLDATLFAQTQQYCVSFVVTTSNPSALACMTDKPNVLPRTTGLALTADFGQTWQRSESLVSPAPVALVGATDTSITFVRYEQGVAQLARYDHPSAGSWSAGVALPDWMTLQPFGTAPPLAQMPDGTFYQPYARGNTGAVSVGLDAVPPGASHVTQVAHAGTLRAKGLTPTLAFGDLDGDTPALYLGVGDAQNKGDISPLYRLALPATTTPPRPHWTAVVQFPTVPAPATPHPPGQCAADPETTAAIRPGGLGALNSTFAARWGGDAGVALGMTYFGRYQDTGMPIVGVPSTALGAGARVPNLTYHVDSTAHVTLAQAQAIAATILPADVHAIPNGAPPSPVSPITDTYCSAALWAAFPPGTPSFTYGELAVTYTLRSDGTVDSIDFAPAIIG